jgi:hypothetical protein
MAGTIIQRGRGFTVVMDHGEIQRLGSGFESGPRLGLAGKQRYSVHNAQLIRRSQRVSVFTARREDESASSSYSG